MSSTSIRKLHALSVQEKLHIIDKINSGESRKSVADQFNIPRSTLSGLLAQSVSLRQSALENPQMLKAKRLKKVKHLRLEEAILLWVKQMQADKVALSGPIIQKKALQIAKELDINDFSASGGWFDRFKKRNGISWRPIVPKSDAKTDEILTMEAEDKIRKNHNKGSTDSTSDVRRHLSNDTTEKEPFEDPLAVDEIIGQKFGPSEYSSEPSSASRCLVCNSPSQPVYDLTTTTSFSEKPIHMFLESFTGTSFAEEVQPELSLCEKCFASIERFDELQHQCEFIQNRITNLFHENHSETVFLKEEPDSSLSGEDSEPVAKKRKTEEEKSTISHRSHVGAKANTEKHSSHIENLPKGGKLYCEGCSKHFPSKASTQIHFATDHGRSFGPVDCPICSKRCQNPSALRFHYDVHLNDFPCERCGKSFLRKEALLSHMIAHDDLLRVAAAEEKEERNHLEEESEYSKQYKN